MPVPGIIDDGNFSKATQNGAPVPSFPFFDKGDAKSFTMRVSMRVDQRYYRPPQPMTQRMFPGYGVGYLVDIQEPSISGVGNLVDYFHIYASLPETRTEYGTAMYNMQAILAPNVIVDINDSWPARYVYEYSLNKPLPILYRPQILVVTGVDELPAIAQVAHWKDVVNNKNVLAENSTNRIWKGKIFERLSIFVDLPTFGINPALNV